MNDRSISVEDLASEAKIDEDKLRSVLKGEANLSLTQLKCLAKFFNRGLLFFIAEGDVNETKLRTSGFRTLANEHPEIDPHIKSLMERVERQRKIFLDLREELGVETPQKFRPPAISDNEPKAAAVEVRKWLKMNGQSSFDDYRRSIESRGVLVFRSNGYLGPWRIPTESLIEGFSIFHHEFPIIFVRKQEAKARELFTLAHELGHLILHGAGSIDDETSLTSSSGTERVVNAFAGYLLVPDAALASISDNSKPDSVADFDQWLRSPSQRCGVSVEVILRRLLEARRITRQDYQSYRVWRNQQTRTEKGSGARSYRYREPVHVFGRPFVGTVLEALGSKQITVTKASRFLDNIKITDVHRLQREFNAF